MQRPYSKQSDPTLLRVLTSRELLRPKSETTMKFGLQMRNKTLVNTDPQRRCYNGCHFSYEMHWNPWEQLSSGVSRERAESQMQYFVEINEFAVSQRGENARSEFRIVETP